MRWQGCSAARPLIDSLQCLCCSRAADIEHEAEQSCCAKHLVLDVKDGRALTAMYQDAMKPKRTGVTNTPLPESGVVSPTPGGGLGHHKHFMGDCSRTWLRPTGGMASADAAADGRTPCVHLAERPTYKSATMEEICRRHMLGLRQALCLVLFSLLPPLPEHPYHNLENPQEQQ